MPVPKNNPNCPICDDAMILRTRRADQKQFWSCTRFPNCRGTRNVGEENKKVENNNYAAIKLLPGSDEQEAIWKYMLQGKGHLVVNAGPGVGKTWASIQGCLRMPKTKKIFFVAFNLHIAKEAQGKLAASGCGNVEAMTFHGLGNRILKQTFKGTVHKEKMTEILEGLSPMPLINKAEWRRGLQLAEKLCRFVKNYNLDYKAEGFKEEIERIADHHALELNGVYPAAFALIAPALEECKKRAEICWDFDDMIWLPIVLDLSIKYPADVIITDESQDLNVVQHELIFRATRPNSRVFVVGDRRQSMYGFRGADTSSMDKLRDRLGATALGVQELPMTLTRRCPKSHVRLAKAISPEIEALPEAPEGEVLSMPYAKAVEAMKPGDMVLCRVNAELLRCAYSLIKRRIRPVVKGRDLGEGLISLLDRLAKDVDPEHEMASLREALSRYRYEQEGKLLALGDKAESRMLALADKCDCMVEFIANASSIDEMRTSISTLFDKSDEGAPLNSVVLGTVHRTKGLEAERVFVLAPELIPHPAAKKPWERQQESNIAWVACTRAKFNSETGAPGTLVFCGPIPAIYNYQPPPPPPLEEADLEPLPPAPAPPVKAKPVAKPVSKPVPSKPPVKKADDDEPPF